MYEWVIIEFVSIFADANAVIFSLKLRRKTLALTDALYLQSLFLRTVPYVMLQRKIGSERVEWVDRGETKWGLFGNEVLEERGIMGSWRWWEVDEPEYVLHGG